MTLLSEMSINEYDKRQISLMKDMLTLYESGKISLKKLIDSLEGLLFCLQSVDVKWKDEFHEHWFVLEQIYAVASFRKESISQDDPDLLNALKNINELLSK